MFEPAGRVSESPPRTEQRKEPRSGPDVGSPFFAYFLWRSKESECAVGRTTRHQPRQRSDKKTANVRRIT